MEALHYKSRASRHPVELAGMLTRENGKAEDVLLSDLSLDGCRVRGFFLVGDLVKLKLPKIGELDAQVRWAVLGQAGLRFLRSAGR
jgi:hypothetical protein